MIKKKHPETVGFLWKIHSLKLTVLPLKMVVSNRNLLFKESVFRGYVSFREGNSYHGYQWFLMKHIDLKERFGDDLGKTSCSFGSFFEY